MTKMTVKPKKPRRSIARTEQAEPMEHIEVFSMGKAIVGGFSALSLAAAAVFFSASMSRQPLQAASVDPADNEDTSISALTESPEAPPEVIAETPTPPEIINEEVEPTETEIYDGTTLKIPEEEILEEKILEEEIITAAEAPVPSTIGDIYLPPEKTTEETIINGKFSIPQQVDDFLHQITNGHAVSYDLVTTLIGTESGFKAGATSKTNARGYAQWTGAPFIERLYKDKALLAKKHQPLVGLIGCFYRATKTLKEAKCGEEKAAGRHVFYRVAGNTNKEKEANRAALLALAYDPEVALTTTVQAIPEWLKDMNDRFRKGIVQKIEHIEKTYKVLPVERLQRLREHLVRPLTYVDAKNTWFAGARGAAEIALANADIASHHLGILGFIPAHVITSNDKVFAREGGGTLKVPEYMTYMNKRMGNKVLDGSLQFQWKPEVVASTLDLTH